MEITPERLVELKTVTPEGLEKLKEIANSDADVIITGNHGSGKTTLAKIILSLIDKDILVALVGFKETVTPYKHHYKEYNSIDDLLEDNIRHSIVLIDNHYIFDWDKLKKIKGRKIIITINPHVEREIKKLDELPRDVYIIRMRQMKDPSITRSYAKVITSIKRIDRYTGEVKTIYTHKL